MTIRPPERYLKRRTTLKFIAQITALAMIFAGANAFAAIKTVCDSGCDHQTIQAAISDTGFGDTIQVETARTYDETDLNVSGKTLISTGSAEAFIINGAGCSNYVINTGSGGVVEGFTITGCVKNDNSNGAGIVSNGTTVISNVIVTGNSTDGNYAGIWHNGGGGTLTIRNSEIRNNTAESMPALSSVAPDLKIYGLKVYGNTATGPIPTGSVSIMRHLGLTAHIVGLEIFSNSAAGANIQGGALNITCNGGSRKVGIFNSQIINNLATGSSTARGGGVSISSCEADIVDTTVSGNVLVLEGGSSQGGGFYTSTAARDIRLFAGSTVTGNTADSGGGVWCASGRWQVSGSITGNTQVDTDFVNGNNSCGEPAEVGVAKPSSGTSGDPVNTLTGELFDFFEPDIELGGPLPLEFVRFYNSSMAANGYVGTLGRNWLHNFEFFFDVVNSNNIEILTPGGQQIKFYRGADDTWVRYEPTQTYFQLAEDATDYILYDPDSRLFYTFDKSQGLLQSVSDSNGNTHTLTWAGSLIESVADGLGRSLAFAYDGLVLQSVTGGSRILSFTHNGSRELLTMVDARGNTTTYTYKSSPDGLLETTERPETNIPFTQAWDTQSRVIKQTDAYLNEFGFSYDDPAEGQTTVTNPEGDTVVHTHDSAGVLVEAKDEAGNSTVITPDDNNNRAGNTDPLGTATSVVYDEASGYAVQVTDGENNTFTFTYEPRFLANGITEYDLVRADYPDASFELWQYDSFGNITTHTDTAGHDWIYTYDAMGNVLTETNPSSGVTTYTYLPDGNLDTVTDPAGNITDHDYDADKRLVLTSLADGTSRQYDYDDNDNLLTRTDETGADQVRSYDKNNNLVKTGDGVADNIDLSWDDMDRLSQLAPGVGNPTTITYDSLGRVASMSGPDNNVLTYGYDNRGRITSLNDSAGPLWTATYDDIGRKTSQANALGHSTSFVYDDADRPVQVTDAEGTLSQYTYDGMDRITSASVAGSNSAFEYDPQGLPKKITIAPGVETSISYNEMGKIEQVTDSLGRNWSYTHDAGGRVLTSVDPLSRVTQYGFDKRNRHNKTIFPGSMGTLDIGHDGRGNMTSLVYSDGTNLVFGYDDMGALTSANGVAVTRDKLGRVVNSNGIINTWGATGSLDKITLSGGDVDYSFDTRGQLTQVQDWLGGQTSMVYDAAGRLLSVTYANGLSTHYTYNKINGITSVEHRNGNTVLLGNDLVRNPLGQITSANRSYPDAGELNLQPSSSSFLFDPAMQTQAFTHDDMGKRTSDNLHQYSWSLASRLISYTADAGATTIDLAYNGLGHITGRDDGNLDHTFTWNYATAHPCIAEMTGGEIRYNVCAPDGRLLYSITTGNDRWFYHFDEMGNVQMVTNNAGEILAVYRYSPFGQLLVDSSNGNLDNPFTFQGRAGVLTERNGLYVFQSRVYDARTGRFLTRDPVTGFDPVTVNPYQYAMNNPMLFVDPDGAEGIKAEDIFSGGVGVFAALVDRFAPGSIEKLEKAAAAAGSNSPKAIQQAKSAANAKKLSNKLGKLGVAAWIYSAYQEIDSTNDKVNKTVQRQDRQLKALLDAYYGNMKSVTELYRQKKITYHRWRAWMDLIERQYNEGIDSTISSSRLEIVQDGIEGMLKGVGSVILPSNATDCMMKWMGRNVPSSDYAVDKLTEWSSG